MQTIYLHHDTPLPPPCAATIGFFDGVHRGHQYLIDRLRQSAHSHGLESMVITFDRHPRQVLHADYVPQLLSTLDMKLRRLEATGVDRVVVLGFDRQMASLSARDFMAGVLSRRLNVRLLLTGYDNRFGHDRAEGFDDYVEYGRQTGISVEASCEERVGGMHVSSSAIRRMLAEGDVAHANECLGYEYAISGTVVRGYGEGHKLGFPTANIDPRTCHVMLPANGVYAVWARTGSDSAWHKAMLNIGVRPTFGGQHVTIETNIFGLSADLYGSRLTLRLVSRIRGERKFGSADELGAQLAADRDLCLRML